MSRESKESKESKEAKDELLRSFNSALVKTAAGPLRDFSAELFELVETPAFRKILASVGELAAEQGLSQQEAAERIVTTFRTLDRIWKGYLFQEGIDRIFRS